MAIVNAIFAVQKAFRSYKSSSVTKRIHFTQLFCFLSNIINCQEQLKTKQQTEKKKKNALPSWEFALYRQLLYVTPFLYKPVFQSPFTH